MELNLSIFFTMLGILYTSDYCLGQILNAIAPNARVQTVFQHHVGGGGLLGGNIGLDQCDTLCRTDPTCSSFDWVKDPPGSNINRCYRHDWMTTCNGYAVRRGHVHVDYLLCSIAPCLTGGTTVIATSQDDCLFRCRQSPTCASAQLPNRRQFDPNSCVHYSIFEPCPTAQHPSNQVCRQYRRTSCETIAASIRARALVSTTTVTPTTPDMTTPTTGPATTEPLLRAHSVLEQVDNFHVLGGILQRTIRDVTTCVRTCSTSRDCFALDFVRMDNSCWFHTVTSGCAPLKPLDSSTHYKFIKCYRNMHLYGGKEIAIVVPSGGNSLAACIEKCSADIGCYGVDFNQRNLRCFHHSGLSECNTKNVKYGCDHFQLQDVKCQRSVSIDSNKPQKLAVNSAGIISLGSYIIKGPFEEPDSWVNIPEDGSIRTNGSNTNTTTTKSITNTSLNQTLSPNITSVNSTQSRDLPTTRDLPNTTDLIPQNDSNNDLDTNAKSATNDLEARSSLNNIHANTSNLSIEIPTDDNTNDNNDTLTNSNVKKNDLDSDNLDIDLGTEDVPDVTSTMNLNEDHPDIVVRYPQIGPIRFNRDGTLRLTGAQKQDSTEGEFVDVAEIRNIVKVSHASILANHVIPGGIKLPEVMTFPGCISACNQSKGCLATDYDFDLQECYFHSVTTVCSDLAYKVGVYHVRFAMCPIPVSEESITVQANAPGGVLQPQINTYRKCHAGCQGDKQCQAFDFNFYGRVCYFHEDKTACNKLGRAPGVVHVKKMNCPE